MKETVSHQFTADVHLGRLAKWLRLLGIDVWYQNSATPEILIETALAENRVLLSKYAGFARQPALQFFQLHSSNSIEQLQQVIAHYHLKNVIQPFTRCLICNGSLHPVSKAAIEARLLPGTKEVFYRFWQCGGCQRIYWEGSHYERMLQLVKQVQVFES